MKRFEHIKSDYIQWADEVFPHATPESIVNHLKREVSELEDKNDDPMEIADCQLLLMHLAHKNNIDLEDAIETKLWINMRREWGEPDEFGVSEHIRKNKSYVNLIERTIGKYPKTTALVAALGILASLVWWLIFIFLF